MKILTNDNYFEPDEYMSVSAFKRFNQCEVKGLVPFSNEKSIPLLVGSYVDAYVEGSMEQFKSENPEIFVTRFKENEDTIGHFKAIAPSYLTKNDTFVAKTKPEAVRLYPEYFTKIQYLKSDYTKADVICEFIDNDVVFQQFMSGEKQTIMTCNMFGVPFKSKYDSYSKGVAINDLKCMWKVTDKNGTFYDFITPWGYDIQMACYQENVRQNTGEKLPCYICAVTKEKTINSIIVHVEQVYLDRALYKVESLIGRYQDIKLGKIEPVGCGVCDVCIANRSGTLITSLGKLIDGSV